MWSRSAIVACLGAFGTSACSAHDVVKPNVDEAPGAVDAGQNDGAEPIDGDVVPGAPSADCNLAGIWITKMVSISQALSLNQTASSWHYLEIDQPAGNAEFTVKRSIDCGSEVHGTVTVTFPVASIDAGMKRNDQIGRKGTIKKTPSGQCGVDVEQFWIMIGAEDRFLPPRNAREEIEPVAARIPLPTLDRPEGAQDWDGDGKLGMLWQVSGIVQGTRNVVQRQWNRWFSTERYAVTPSMNWTEITVAADFDKDEAVFDPTSGPLVSPSFSVRTPETPNRFVMHFLGRDKSDPRVTALVRGTDPAADLSAARETCYRIQDTLRAEDM
jgi:hypothetical protein